MRNLGLCGFLPWVVYGAFVISIADSQTNNSAHVGIKTRAFDPEQSDNIVLDPRSWRPRAAAPQAAFVATLGSVATAAVAFSFTYGDSLRFFFKSHALQPLSPTAQSQHRPGPRKPISWLQRLQLLMMMMSIAEQGSFCPGSRSHTRGGQFAATSKACARPRPGEDETLIQSRLCLFLSLFLNQSPK